MKVALVSELFHPSIGGQEFRFMQLAKGLLKRGVEVEIYTSDHMGHLPAEEVIEGIKVRRYVVLRKYVKPNSRRIFPLMKYVVKTRRLIKRLAKESDYVIINQMPILHLFLTPYNDEVIIDWCETYEIGLLKCILSCVAKRFERGTAVSEEIANAIKLYNPLAKVEVIRTPLDVDKYACGEREKEEGLILFIGRLVPHKNIISLVNAISYVNSFSPLRKWKLIVAGDGPLRSTIIAMQKKTKEVEVVGKVSEERKLELLKKAYLLAIPSFREGFPNIVAEAIASCTPILTVKTPLNNLYRFVKRHKIGFVAPSPSWRDIASSIVNINYDAWHFAVLSEAKLREEFREDHVINRLLCFLRRVKA
jgi:glycosyltransferase involved in cell wall biosynthesis